MRNQLTLLAMCVLCLAACTTQQQVKRTAQKTLFAEKTLANAHIGICIYDATAEKYLYHYQSEKYFVPASNIKLVSLYAGLLCLGDSLPGIRYTETSDAVYLQPTGDPTLLHSDFKEQPVIKWLQQVKKPVYINGGNWREKPLGYGWSWDDYNAAYMVERSPLPVYGNVIKWTQVNEQKKGNGAADDTEAFVYSEPEVNWKVNFSPQKKSVFTVTRHREENIYDITEGKEMVKTIEIPFATHGLEAALELLEDTIAKTIQPKTITAAMEKTLYSQPADSMYRLMMHRSDNFFAEQTLLMAAEKKLGFMNTARIIDTLLKKELNGFPQAPNWVDGSGLSRYNLFSPQDFVWLLQKMKQGVAWKRLTTILATGNEGTLRNYYTGLEGKIYAKTGTLSGQVALSGYLITQKNHTLVFSVLVNNHQTTATVVRRAVEKLLMDLYKKR